MKTNSELSRRALPAVARIASLGALLLSVACADSSSSAPPAARTTAQALAQTDLTATETVNGATRSYIATVPPAAVVGTVAQTIEAQWNPGHLAIGQAPIYPQGWSIDYYAGNTKLPAAPTTASGWARVSRMVTTGSIDVEALDGERQALISNVTAPPPVVAPTFSSGSTGDGWDVFFDAAYTKVFNIHHHNGPNTVMCHNLADSTPCPGFPMQLTQTSDRSTGRIDTPSNKLWQPTVVKAGPKLAWDCVDLNTASRCATPVVLSQLSAASDSYNSHVDPVVIGRKMYAIGFAANGVSFITCLDMATGTECPGVQLAQNGSFTHSGLGAVGNRLYVLPTRNLNLDCFDSTTWQRCPGSWPKPVDSSPVWGVRGPDSLMNNICTNNECFALDGGPSTLPPNFLAYLAANPVVGFSITSHQVGNGSSVGTRAAWSINTNKSVCWDMTTDALCSAAFPIPVPALYTSIMDPEDPNCLWTNGDDGVIRNWNVRTGASGCGDGPPRISFKAAVSIPRLSCDPASRVYQYKTFRLIAPSPSQYTSATLTVKDPSGAPIPGWINRPIPASTIVDLTGLSPAVAGNEPTFDVTAVGFTNTTVVPQGEFRVTTGSPPQMCWDLSEAALVCPAGPGLAGNEMPGPRQTTITAKGSFRTGANTTPFTDQVLTPTVNTNPPNYSNCGGSRLRATVVTLTDGSPVAGARVLLLDSAGNPVLDANGQPASAVTAADGSVEFPVWSAGYKLRLSGTNAYTPVFASVTAGGSGMTFPSGGTVTSNTVTTTAGQTSQADFVVSSGQPSGPHTPCAPVVTGPAAGSVVYQKDNTLTGTAEPGHTVTVKANGQTVCTVVANAQGQWSCQAELPVGQNVITATSRDSSGNDSGTSSGVLVTRREGINSTVITGPPSTVNNKEVKVTGTAHPDADVTVKDKQGNTVCTAKADSSGNWQCDATLAVGPHELTADAQWGGFGNTSGPHDTTVLDEAWYQGSGCASTGAAQPALMMLLALGGLVVLRRRRA